MTAFDPSLEHARTLDRSDPLHRWRDEFWLPSTEAGSPDVYFVGNSLGLQPKRTSLFLQEELEKWQRLGVKGHFESDHPWMPYHEFLAEPMARLVGAHADEVVMMNSLTVNLHLMMATFYRPTDQRHQILIEQHAFPSDHYAVESQLLHHGRTVNESLLLAKPVDGGELLCSDAICEQIRNHAETLALVLLPGVQYYTGQVIDLARITQVAHECGVAVGIDLAHAAGNIPLRLHDWGVDFAVWCSYKYLNSGPGSVAGCFVHRRHGQNIDLPRFAGWWGHDKATRFLMQNEFQAMPTAEGWQLSNPPILSLAAIRASLAVFDEAGGLEPLRTKSVLLTDYFEQLLRYELPERVRIVTPSDSQERGCQLSLQVRLDGVDGKQVHEQLERAGTVTDWREPDVIRAAPVPLYNSFEDVHRFVTTLKQVLMTV
jgi:kynureninase